MQRLSLKGKRAIVIFDSLFGNTQRIAIGPERWNPDPGGVGVDCVNVHDVDVEKLPEYDLIAVGAPTQHLTASSSMKGFLEKMGRESS